MKILLDTHIFLWAITADARISSEHRSLFLDPANELYLSAASIWEIVIKVGIGRLPIPVPVVPYVEQQMRRNDIGLLPIQLDHLAALDGLPRIHGDPFDRMLIAQARAERLPILTVDAAFQQYQVDLL